MQTLQIALDSAIIPKKFYYRELLASLRAIQKRTDPAPGKNGGEAGVGNRTNSYDRERGRGQSRTGAGAREREGGYMEVKEILPSGVEKVTARPMTPAEVRGMINKNCSLIKTVDKDLIPGIERRIKRIYETRKSGASTPETLAMYLEKECDLEPWQADRIVRDQMSKYDAAAERDKLRQQGVRLVRWVHGDCKVPREYHIRHWDGHSGLTNGHPNGLAGYVFQLDNPPVIDEKTGERGYPGDLIMCSCHLEAVE